MPEGILLLPSKIYAQHVGKDLDKLVKIKTSWFGRVLQKQYKVNYAISEKENWVKVRQCCIGLYWALLGSNGLYWTVLGRTGLLWDVLGCAWL